MRTFYAESVLEASAQLKKSGSLLPSLVGRAIDTTPAKI